MIGMFYAIITAPNAFIFKTKLGLFYLIAILISYIIL